MHQGRNRGTRDGISSSSSRTVSPNSRRMGTALQDQAIGLCIHNSCTWLSEAVAADHDTDDRHWPEQKQIVR